MRTREELLQRIVDNIKCPNCKAALGVSCLNQKRDICQSRVREAKRQNIIPGWNRADDLYQWETH